MEATVRINGKRFHVVLEETPGGWSATVDGDTIALRADGGHFVADDVVLDVHARPDGVQVDGRPVDLHIDELHGVAGIVEGSGGRHGPVRPPMNGVLAEICVTDGEAVQAGDTLFVLEAMKMRNEIKSPVAGTVAGIALATGAAVDPSMTVLSVNA